MAQTRPSSPAPPRSTRVDGTSSSFMSRSAVRAAWLRCGSTERRSATSRGPTRWARRPSTGSSWAIGALPTVTRLPTTRWSPTPNLDAGSRRTVSGHPPSYPGIVSCARLAGWGPMTSMRQRVLATAAGGWQAWAATVLDSRWLLAAGASAAVALAIGFRYVDLNHYGFNSDEAVYSGQAAALAGHQDYAKMFGVFRAHPLLVMFVVSLGFRIWGVDDVIPRLVTAGAGVLLVVVAGAVALIVHGRFAAVAAMGLMALSSYPITVARQMLLDGPMALCFGVSLFFMARYVCGERRLDLAAGAASAGLAFLSKETAILMAPAVIVFFLLARDLPFRIGHVALWCAVYGLTIMPFPLSLMFSGGRGTTPQFFVWQLFRRPNHPPDFYLSIISVVGIPLVLLAAIGVGRALARRKAMDILVLSSALVTI